MTRSRWCTAAGTAAGAGGRCGRSSPPAGTARSRRTCRSPTRPPARSRTPMRCSPRCRPTPVVLVAHSLAGLVAPLVAAAAPVRRVVYLAAMLPEPGRSVDDRARAGQRMTRRGIGRAQAVNDDGSTSFRPDGAVELLYPDSPPERAAWAVARLRRQHWRITAEPSPVPAQDRGPDHVRALHRRPDHRRGLGPGRGARPGRAARRPLPVPGPAGRAGRPAGRAVAHSGSLPVPGPTWNRVPTPA